MNRCLSTRLALILVVSLLLPLAASAQPLLGSTPFGYINPVGQVQLPGASVTGGGVGGLNNLNMARGVAGGIGMGIGLAVLQNLLSSDTPAGPNPAEAQAQLQAQQAAAAQAAEAQRLAQIQTAAQWRADWDTREQEMSDQLAGVFDVVPSTSFFGIPGNPDPDAVAQILQDDSSLAFGDPSVVDLSDIPDALGRSISPDFYQHGVVRAQQTPSYPPPASIQPFAASPTPPDAFLKWGVQKEIGYMKNLEWESGKFALGEFPSAVKLYELGGSLYNTWEEYTDLKELMQGKIVEPLLEKDMENIGSAASGKLMPHDFNQMGHDIDSEAHKSIAKHMWDGFKEALKTDKESTLEEGTD
jgi:hypothetical protein